MKHPTMSVERVLQLFDSLIKPIVMFGSEVWGIGNCGEIDKYFGGFLKKLLRVSQAKHKYNHDLCRNWTFCSISIYLLSLVL